MENLPERQRLFGEAFKVLERTSIGYGATATEGGINGEEEYEANFEFPNALSAASWAEMVRNNWGVHANLRDTIGSLWQSVVLTAYVSYNAADLMVNQYKKGRLEVRGANLKKGDVLLRFRGEDVRYLVMADVEVLAPGVLGLEQLHYATEFKDTPKGRETALEDETQPFYSTGINVHATDLWPIERY